MKDLLKKISYIIGLSIIVGSLCNTFYVTYSILIRGYIYFIEPNLLILILEFIWVSLGILIFPFIVSDIIKMNINRKEEY